MGCLGKINTSLYHIIKEPVALRTSRNYKTGDAPPVLHNKPQVVYILFIGPNGLYPVYYICRGFQ